MEICELLGMEVDNYPAGAVEACEGLIDGTYDAYLLGATAMPNAQIMEASTQKDLRLIGFTEEELEKIENAFSWFRRYDITHENFGFIPEGEVVKGGVSNFNLTVHRDLPEEVVYAMTKAHWDNIDKIASMIPALKEYTPEVVNTLTVPLHKGAAKYYTEIGIELLDRIKPID